MSQPSKQTIAVVAIVVLVSSLAVTWQVGTVRDVQAEQTEKQQLIDYQVADRQASDDYDGDGVSDADDKCPRRPETENGFQDGDGCPDIVTTTRAS